MTLIDNYFCIEIIFDYYNLILLIHRLRKDSPSIAFFKKILLAKKFQVASVGTFKVVPEVNIVLIYNKLSY